MRIAFFSPLPPARSGIADYSAALLNELEPLAEITRIPAIPPDFDPARYDVLLYQIGNNADHAFCYEAALRWPGFVVLHEANLHHLINPPRQTIHRLLTTSAAPLRRTQQQTGFRSNSSPA